MALIDEFRERAMGRNLAPTQIPGGGVFLDLCWPPCPQSTEALFAHHSAEPCFQIGGVSRAVVLGRFLNEIRYFAGALQPGSEAATELGVAPSLAVAIAFCERYLAGCSLAETSPRQQVTALILAGGRATRLGGVAKHEIVVGGETIFARQRRVLAPRVKEIVVSAPHDVAGHRTVRDVVAGAGPLAGVAAGLAAATTPWLLVVAGDMPYVSGELVDRILAAAAEDAVGVRANGLPEPLLCALRVARARPAIEQLLAAGHNKASGLLDALAVTWLDADPRMVQSVNRPEDLVPE